MARAEYSVDELVSMIKNKTLRLPEMQRRYVWKSTRVRDLLDSLYRGYPSGVILAWNTREDVATNDFAVSTHSNGLGSGMLLLDGQQRLTSLSAVLRGEPLHVRGRKREIDILFNLDHPDELTFASEVDEEEDDEQPADGPDAEADDLQTRLSQLTFVVANKQLKSLPNWVSVTQVLQQSSDVTFLKRAGAGNVDSPNYEKYSHRLSKLRAIRNYIYRVDVLEESMSYEEVTEIFVRVNSLGAKLRSSDLALAQITAKWPGSLKVFQEFQALCAGQGFDLDLSTYLRMLVALLTDQVKFARVSGLSRQELEDGWTRTKRALQHAVNFARENAHIESPALLSSPFALVAVGYWADQRDFCPSNAEASAMRRWLLTANAKGRWSRGSSEGLLNEDIAILRDGGGPTELFERLRSQVGRLDISPGDLAGRTTRSALFKTMYLAFKRDGAQDWNTKLEISVKSSGSQDKIQFHHIFPKAFLAKRRQDLSKGQIDDIANLVFIGGSTNREIGARDPRVYLPLLTAADGQPLDKQQVPTDEELFSPERYLDFLETRRISIAKRLNEFLDADI